MPHGLRELRRVRTQNREVNTDDGEGVSVHGSDHDGELRFETDASTNELVDQLQDIKAAAGEDDR